MKVSRSILPLLFSLAASACLGLYAPWGFAAEQTPAPVATPVPAASVTPVTAVAPTAAATIKPRVGAWVRLTQGEQEFNAVLNDDVVGRRKGAVLVVADMGGAPDGAAVVAPLVQQLPKAGWTSLALALPEVPAGHVRRQYGALIPAAMDRVKAALDYLTAKNFRPVILVGHGLGAAVCANYLASNKTDSVLGLVVVGLNPGDDLEPPLDLKAAFSKIAYPVLDIYGLRDFAHVRVTADERREAMRKAQLGSYTRVALGDANHWFTGLDLFMVNRIRGWMDRRLATFAKDAPPADTASAAGGPGATNSTSAQSPGP